MSGKDVVHRDESNGILVQVPGATISEAQNTLLPAGPDVPEVMYVETECSGVGLVRIRYRAKKNPRRGFSNWFWVAEHAERA